MLRTCILTTIVFLASLSLKEPTRYSSEAHGSNPSEHGARDPQATESDDSSDDAHREARTSAAHGNEATRIADVEKAARPDLRYLAWQMGGVKSTGRPIPTTLWDLEGRVLSDQRSRELLKQVNSFDVHWRRDGELRPLVMVFKVDQRIIHSPIMPVVVVGENRYTVGRSARTRPTNGFNVSAVAPRQVDAPHTLQKWPDHIDLELKFPIDRVTVTKTLEVAPDASIDLGPVDVGPGIQWYVDAADRWHADESIETNRFVSVLEFDRRQTDDLTSYSVRVRLRGGDRLREHHVAGKPGIEFRVSEVFDDRNQIERVEFRRQRFAKHRIDNVPLRTDLLKD